jgi:hypothetical protein
MSADSAETEVYKKNIPRAFAARRQLLLSERKRCSRALDKPHGGVRGRSKPGCIGQSVDEVGSANDWRVSSRSLQDLVFVVDYSCYL